MHGDLNKKVNLLDVGKTKLGPVTSINETNPIRSNSKEDLDEFIKENPQYNEYLETWGPQELMRLTFTTEEFDEEQPPIIGDDKALMFRYVMHEMDDDMMVPSGSFLIEGASSMIH